MPLPPAKFREIVFQLLYARDFHPSDEDETIEMVMRELKVAKPHLRKAMERVLAIEEKLPLIDKEIAKASKSYDFERIPRVERNILRLGAFELLFDPSIPFLVAFAEAIRLTKKFSTPEGSTFVNAVLDAIYQEKKSES
jgi:N utilization substance protein B